MDGGKLSALYTLQHSLPRDAKEPHGISHRDIAFWRFFNEE
jgi:hypothetical protein